MKQTKKELIRQTIILVVTLLVIISNAIEKKANETAEIIGKQQNYNMETEEPVTFEIEQSIEKCVVLENNDVLLQQKIVVNSNKEVNKEKEQLEIKVPNMKENQPQTIIVLTDGKRLAKGNYNYDAENNQLNIETSQKIKTYKIIYTYPETNIEAEEIQLSTKASIKVENQEEKEVQDEQTVTMEKSGEAISIQEKMTKEIHKGYLYEAKENETIYGENYIVEVSSIVNEEEMEITKEKEVYTYNIKGENEEDTKIENNTNQSTYFKQTAINKAQMLDILGEDRNNNN